MSAERLQEWRDAKARQDAVSCDKCGGSTEFVRVNGEPVYWCVGDCQDLGCCALKECDPDVSAGFQRHRGPSSHIVRGASHAWRSVSGFDPVTGVDLWARDASGEGDPED